MNSKALAKSIAILGLVLLVSPVSGAEPLPELDCLVEPNVVVDVGSPEHGVVETISVDRSDTVAADEVLAKLESSEQAANVRKARARSKMAAEINARKATLAFAQRKQQRMSDLFASDAISTQQRDEVETELKMAQMQLQQARDAGSLARIELDRAVGDLDRRTIRSPISGIVVERFVSPGEYVNEKPLLRVAQMHPLRVETVAPAKLFGQIKAGMRARVVSDTLGGQVFDAEVTIVDRMIDAASGTFGVRLELPNPDYAIPSGLNCRLQIDPNTLKSAAVEPVEKPVQTVKTKPPVKKQSSTAQPVQTVKTKPPVKKQSTTVQPVQTVKSKSSVKKPDSAVPVAASTQASPVKQPTQECRSLGPFSNEKKLDAFVAALGSDSREIDRRKQRDTIDTGYFVMTKPLPDMNAARTLAASIRERGAKDLAVMSADPYKGRIALGTFGKKANAVARLQKMRDLDLDVEILPKRVVSEQFWSDVELSASTIKKAPWKDFAPGVIATECSASTYVMADAANTADTP